MCGIFGLVTKRDAVPGSILIRMANDLFRLSESRGKESAGLAILSDEAISVYKEPVAASTMIRGRQYAALLQETLGNTAVRGTTDGQARTAVTLMGHSRLVTNGSQENHDNNQPVIKDGIVAIHNGIVVNAQDLWQAFPVLHRTYQVDTEIVLSLLRYFYSQTQDLVQAVRTVFERLRGTASIAAMFDDLDAVLIVTNNGSLYTCASDVRDVYVFASEAYILRQLTRQAYLRPWFSHPDIRPVEPGVGYVVGVLDMQMRRFELNPEAEPVSAGVSSGQARPIADVTPPEKRIAATSSLAGPTAIPESIYRRFEIDPEPIGALRRCTRCILPETMPFIEFDEEGVCNYCTSYQQVQILGKEALLELVEQYRTKDGKPDCLVTFSGGRDSSFCVHYVKVILNMNPITYTYDWGMVTDLARRNQARLCGKLGLEHILVSADIARKRENIRKNVSAWLRLPDLGMVPLFMAGDKQYFYYANELRKQTGVELIVLGENLLETTRFKSGFCGIRPSFSTEHTYTLSLVNKARLALYYGRQYLSNPAYMNSSLWDTLGAFASYYVIPHNNVNLYNYIMWDEKEIISTLVREYDWEVATDTRATWRIGDGTAAFYNYIYYCVAGFSENDTFRSNQIREGVLSRERALSLVYEENQPRLESIQWYCDTIGIDMESALARIQSIPKLYSV